MISLSASLGFGPPARRVKVGAHVRGETMAREARSETVATKRKRAEKRAEVRAHELSGGDTHQLRRRLHIGENSIFHTSVSVHSFSLQT